jgi:hypothetical protein
MTSVSTEQQRAVRTLYCNLMFEVRHRLDFLLRLRDGVYNLPVQPACELGYLELRLVCETVALACLAVNGEAPGARAARIRSAHEADLILNSLERLHPQFYPEPGMFIGDAIHGRIFIPSAAGFMTKAELVKLYRECGQNLHRGDYGDAGVFPQLEFDPIGEAITKFVELLRFHRIAFLGSDDEMWVIMNDPETGKVRGTLERPA